MNATSDVQQGTASAVNEGLWRGHGGFELALTPLLFGLLGYWIDGLIGTRPILTVLFCILAFGGVVAKTYYTYRYRMQELADAKTMGEASNG